MMPVHTTYFNIYIRAPLYVEMYLPTVALVACVITEIISPCVSFRMIRFDPDDFGSFVVIIINFTVVEASLRVANRNKDPSLLSHTKVTENR